MSLQYIFLSNLLNWIIWKKSPYKGIAYITFNWCLSLTLCLDLLKEESVTLAWKKSHNHEPLSAYLPIFENGNTWDQKYWYLQEYSKSALEGLWYELLIWLSTSITIFSPKSYRRRKFITYKSGTIIFTVLSDSWAGQIIIYYSTHFLINKRRERELSTLILMWKV